VAAHQPGKWLRDHPDGNRRCWWCGDDPLYVAYHDDEWGKPVHDDRLLFEKICLEGFQSGLSWLTILRKRENFRRAFANFDVERISHFDEADIARLMADAGIVRHRGKIESTINNARRCRDIVESHGSLSRFVWEFRPSEPEGDRSAPPGIPSQTPSSVRLSKALKKSGWTFVGPTTMYAFMQSVGVVNDHLEGCRFRHATGRSLT
jgi:DNA-3-methyladenine glycosylase I